MPIPSFEELLQPTLDALHQLGGVPTIKAINQQVVQFLPLAPDDIAQPHGDTKQTELEYRLAWARTYLKHYGLIDNPKRGVWTLTERGRATKQVEPKTVSTFVQELIKKGKVDSGEPIDNIVGQTPLDVGQRLTQWREEATNPAHPNYSHADLDQPGPIYATVSGLLQKLRETPNEFGHDDVVALFGTLNSGQRMKNKVADKNPLPVLREALLALVDGPGAPTDKIAAADRALKFASHNMLGELYGWANTETAPLYNGCATASLHHLGYIFGDKDYAAFVAAHEQFKQVYRQQVGQLRPDLPLNLEIDKLYNVIDKVDLKSGGDPPPPTQRYWRITLPDQLEETLPNGEKKVFDLWNPCLAHGIAAIGFGDNKEEFQVQKFMSIRPGDRVVAFLRHKTIGAIGKVTKNCDENLFRQRPVEQDYWQGFYWFRIDVEWQAGQKKVDELPLEARNKFLGQTIVELSQSEYDAVAKLFASSPFTTRTFELLENIHATPTKAYYQAHKEELKQLIEKPFQRVFRQVAERLPKQIRAMMETENHIFARFLKNDWGKGGTWDFYWGAFYPKGGKRTEDAQLSMWMDRQLLEYGFYIGAYGNEQRLRFQRNCQEFGPTLLSYLRDALPETVVSFGSPDNFQIAADGSVKVKTRYTWEEFLRNPAQAENDVSVIVPTRQLLALSEEDLVTRIAETYAKLFPLVLLAVDDDPLPAIGRYLEAPPPDDPPEPYDRQTFLTFTYLRGELADDIYEMLLDKKQVIFSGPPGTGKTYVAQELAKWITGLAMPPAGRVEMIQFHPAYSYEDFIEGIRPESKHTGDGRFMVDYPTRPGVFRRFCKIAHENPEQKHVFIIDEMNRGNIPRIFGELMLLLEYRERDVPLPYSGERFRIPPNVYLIGTMNTADRSIALVDFALRRRFHFFQFGADPDLLERWLNEHPVPIPYLAKLYRRLSQEAIDDPAYALGVSYFMDKNLTEEKLARIWRRSIVPYLAEYHVEQRARIKNWEWESEFMDGIRSGA